jgi:hypothetical protein
VTIPTLQFGGTAQNRCRGACAEAARALHGWTAHGSGVHCNVGAVASAACCSVCGDHVRVRRGADVGEWRPSPLSTQICARTYHDGTTLGVEGREGGSDCVVSVGVPVCLLHTHAHTRTRTRTHSRVDAQPFTHVLKRRAFRWTSVTLRCSLSSP